jgi:hypothetical protein
MRFESPSMFTPDIIVLMIETQAKRTEYNPAMPEGGQQFFNPWNLSQQGSIK